jgi:hypothetical protein
MEKDAIQNDPPKEALTLEKKIQLAIAIVAVIGGLTGPAALLISLMSPRNVFYDSTFKTYEEMVKLSAHMAQIGGEGGADWKQSSERLSELSVGMLNFNLTPAADRASVSNALSQFWNCARHPEGSNLKDASSAFSSACADAMSHTKGAHPQKEQ